jgi:hypothetical protein
VKKEVKPMEQILKQILGKLNNLEEGQKSLQERFEADQEDLLMKYDNLEVGQKSLLMMQKILVENQKSFENRLERVEKKIDHLELGQQEIKETLKHNMTLFTENITAIRQDMRKMRT